MNPDNPNFRTDEDWERRYDQSQNQNKIMKAALEFYANKENWQHGIAYSQNNLLIESDMYCERGDHFYGGKAARQALAEAEKVGMK